MTRVSPTEEGRDETTALSDSNQIAMPTSFASSSAPPSASSSALSEHVPVALPGHHFASRFPTHVLAALHHAVRLSSRAHAILFLTSETGNSF